MADAERLSAETPIEEVRARLSSDEAAAALSVEDLLVASEVAYVNRDLATSVRAMTLLVARDPDSAPFHHRLAVLLFESGDAAGAAESAARAVAYDPGLEPAHDLHVQARLQAGDVDGALAAAEARATLCGPSQAAQLQRARLLVQANRIEEALQAVHSVNDAGTPTEESLLMEIELAYRSGDLHAASSAAARAARLWPDAAAPRDKLARILFELSHHGRAIPLLLRLREEQPDDASVCHLLAASYASMGKNRLALDEILHALRIDPENGEYLYMAGVLSNRLGEREQGIRYLRQALAASPDKAEIHVELAHALAHANEDEEAVEVIDRASQLAPASTSVRDLRLFLLAKRSGREPVAYAGGSGLFPPMPRAPWRDRPARPPSRFAAVRDQLVTQARVLTALVLRDFRHRTAQGRFGFLSLFIPQAINIVTLGIVLSLFNGGMPPIGGHLFFFYATGVMPFYLFIHVIDHSQNLFQDNIGVLQVPVIARLDLVLAMALTELLIGFTVIVVTFGTFELISYGPRTDSHIEAVYATLAVWLFALGLGLISAVMNNLWRPWANGWMIMQRFLYVASGVFFLPQSMPEWIREPLSWNPLLQCIEWFRTGFFRDYDPPWLDKTYIFAVAFGTVLVGLILERALRRRMRTQ